MASVDIIILCVLIISMLVGVIRGFIKEVLSLLSWIAALFLAAYFSLPLGQFLAPFIDNEVLRRISAFVLIFVIVVFLGSLIANSIAKLTTATGLRGVDRALGGLFGLLRGTVVIFLGFLLLLSLEGTQDWWQGSILVPYVSLGIDYARQVMAENSWTIF